MKRRHFRLIALLCLSLFMSGTLIGCGTNAPDSSKDSTELNGDIVSGDEAENEIDGGDDSDSSIDNPFSGGLVNGGGYEGK